jgi:hypothetical protein
MRKLIVAISAASVFFAVMIAVGQGPGRENRGDPQAGGGADAGVTRLLAFDKNEDGKLTKEELNDERLGRLFDRADGNHDGVVTKEELTTLIARESATVGGGRGGPRGAGGGPDDPGGPGGRGPGGPGGFGGPPQPGQVLPTALQDVLRLSDKQKQELAELQKEVDARLDKILSAEQRQQLRELRERGPGGFGPPPGGAGGPGDNPGERRKADSKKKSG